MPGVQPMDWPKALRDYRRRHRLTQAALAETLGVDPTTVSRWERGRDQPSLGIVRRLNSLVLPRTSDVERALKVLIDNTNTIVVLFDNKYRMLWSSPRHRELLRLDASELYGKPFERFQSNAQAELMKGLGGPAGWFRNGVARVEYSLVRQAFERAPNPRAHAHRGTAWTIRDGPREPHGGWRQPTRYLLPTTAPRRPSSGRSTIRSTCRRTASTFLALPDRRDEIACRSGTAGRRVRCSSATELTTCPRRTRCRSR